MRIEEKQYYYETCKGDIFIKIVKSYSVNRAGELMARIGFKADKSGDLDSYEFIKKLDDEEIQTLKKYRVINGKKVNFV